LRLYKKLKFILYRILSNILTLTSSNTYTTRLSSPIVYCFIWSFATPFVEFKMIDEPIEPISQFVVDELRDELDSLENKRDQIMRTIEYIRSMRQTRYVTRSLKLCEDLLNLTIEDIGRMQIRLDMHMFELSNNHNNLRVP
jgi:hypothetical protein